MCCCPSRVTTVQSGTASATSRAPAVTKVGLSLPTSSRVGALTRLPSAGSHVSDAPSGDLFLGHEDYLPQDEVDRVLPAAGGEEGLDPSRQVRRDRVFVDGRLVEHEPAYVGAAGRRAQGEKPAE